MTQPLRLSHRLWYHNKYAENQAYRNRKKYNAAKHSQLLCKECLQGINARNGAQNNVYIIKITQKNAYKHGGKYDSTDYKKQLCRVALKPLIYLGINIGQLTWIIVGAMLFMAIAVGGVMFALNKRRLRMGYVPQYNDDEDDE